MANVAITAIVTNITVDCIAPTIKASPTHTLIEVPLRYSKIIYVQPLTDGLAPEFIEHLIELGYSVEVVPYTQAAGYDYSNPTVKLCFVGGTYSWSSNYYNFLATLELPILTTNNHMPVFELGMCTAGNSNSIYRFRARITDHPIINDLSLNIGDEIILEAPYKSATYISGLTSGTDLIMDNGVLSSRAGLAERIVTINEQDYPRIFFGFQSDMYEAGWDLFTRTIHHMIDPVTYELSMEGLPPVIKNKASIQVGSTAAVNFEGIAPLIITNASLNDPLPSDVDVGGLTPFIWTRNYVTYYLKKNPYNYCSFSSSNDSPVWISAIVITNQRGEVVLNSPDGYRVSAGYIDRTWRTIKCMPGDVLSISVTRNHNTTATNRNVRLYWGHSIDTYGLGLVGLLASGTGVYPQTHNYEWVVPDKKGAYLMSWLVCLSTTSSLCGSFSSSHRTDFTLWIGKPPVKIPYYVFIGDVGSSLYDKKLLPMKGGFLTTEDMKLGSVGRLSSGLLVTDVKPHKKRFMFEFQNMLVRDFDKWVAEQTLSGEREIEILELIWYGHTTFKYVVDFTGDYSHIRLKTNKEWLYGQISFIMEEV